MTPEQLKTYKAGQNQGTTDFFALGHKRFDQKRVGDFFVAGYVQAYDLAEAEAKHWQKNNPDFPDFIS